MIIKKILVLTALFLSIFLIACNGQENDPVINFYNANNQVIETIDNHSDLDIDNITYPELDEIEGRQFLYWSTFKDEINHNQSYDIHPIYTSHLRHSNSYGYRTKLISSDEYKVLFLMDPFANNNIVSIRIYEGNELEDYREIMPEDRIWLSPETIFSIYDHKLYLPAVLDNDQGLSIDIYDLSDDDFYEEITITQESQRSFNEQMFLVSGDHILVETSEWSYDSFEEHVYLDLYDLNTYEFKSTLLSFSDRNDSTSLYKNYDGGLFAYEDQVLIGKPDYLRHDNQPFIYEDDEFSNTQVIERPADIDEAYLPMSAFIENDYLVTKYWILSINHQDKMLFEISKLNDNEEPIYIEFEETVKFLDVKNNKVFLLGYRATRLYVYDLDSQELSFIENDYDTEAMYYYDYSDSTIHEDQLLMTYQKHELNNSDDEHSNYYALFGDEVEEYKLQAIIDGETHSFLSRTIILNDKIYVIGTDETSLYLMVYKLGQTSPDKVIEIEDAKLYNYLSFEKHQDELIIYLTDQTIVIGQ